MLQACLSKFILLGSVMLVGCSSLSSWAEPGSYKGWVTKIYRQEELGSISCLTQQKPSVLANNTFAEIKRARRNRRYLYIVAIVPKSLEINIGDQVEIEPKLCEKGNIPHVTNVLKHCF